MKIYIVYMIRGEGYISPADDFMLQKAFTTKEKAQDFIKILEKEDLYDTSVEMCELELE